jgi:hypothetical protein
VRYDVVVGPDESIPGRPFTDPANTAREAGVMRQMLERERAVAAGWTQDGGGPQGMQLVRDRDGDERTYLLVVPDPARLLAACDLTAVGFFARPREDVDHAVLFDLEEELAARMSAYAQLGLLSYYDVELVKGAYGNLILFATPDVPDEWHADPVHRRAVEISPRHYHEVRLHKGSIPGHFAAGGDITIERTKYFDFTGASRWQALRRFDDAR